MAEVNLESFIQSVDKLAEQMEASKNVSKANSKALEDAKAVEARSAALLQGVSTMFGLNVDSVEDTGGEIVITLDVLQVKTQLVLNAKNKLHNIRILSPDFNWIDTYKALTEASTQEPPNDLRQAISYFTNVQNSINAVTKDVTEYRKLCIVTQILPYKYSFGFKNGLSVIVQFDDCYPQVPNGVPIVSIASSDLNISDEALEKLKNDANSSNFSTLKQLCDFLQNTDI